MSEIKPYMARFPWLTESREASESVDQSQMWTDDEVLKRAKSRVVRAVNEGDSIGTPATDYAPYDTDEENVLVEFLSFPAARIIVSIIDDHRIISRYSQAEAKNARTILESEDDEEFLKTGETWSSPSRKTMSPEDVLSDFGVELSTVEYTERFLRTHSAALIDEGDEGATMDAGNRINFRVPQRFSGDAESFYNTAAGESNSILNLPAEVYSLPASDYVELAGHLKDEKWRLSRRDVYDGTVILPSKSEVLELVEEAVLQRISEKLPLDINEEIAEFFSGAVEDVEANIDEDAFSFEIDRVEEGLFPPVMDHLVEQIRSGAHLRHEERFAVAAFLVNIGMSTDEIVEIFGVSGGYGEDPTRYQVNHIRSGGGDGEPYTPPTYATMESWGLEWETDALEQKVKHPLQYYRVKLQEQDESDGDDGDDGSDDDTEESPETSSGSGEEDGSPSGESE